MFLTSVDSGAVKLTVDGQGVVWYLEGEQMPYCSGQHVDEFVGGWSPPGRALARVVGTPENVPLVLSLYHRFYGHGARSLEVCSPLCSEGPDRNDPELMLYRMRGHGLAPSLGGWHPFGHLDLPSYFLA